MRFVLFVFLRTPLRSIVHASRDGNDRNQQDLENSPIQIAVNPSHMQISRGSSNLAGAHSALAQMDLQPMERNHAAALATGDEKQVSRHVSSFVAEAAALGDNVHRKQAALAHNGKTFLQMASKRMRELSDGVSVLRKAVHQLDEQVGLTTSARSLREKESTSPFQRVSQKVKSDRADEESHAKLHAFNVRSMAGSLESQMQKQYDHFTADESTQSNLASGEKLKLQEQELGELEQGTANIMKWMNQIKKLKMAREEMNPSAKKQSSDATLLAHVEMKQNVESHASAATLAAHEDMERQSGAAATTSSARLSRPSHIYGPHLSASVFLQLAQNRSLSESIATSAVELMQIKSAAEEVMRSVDKLGEWKQRADGSAESSKEAAMLKARLSKALAFLEGHKSLISRRANELNDLMKGLGVSAL
jgi:hypothetical protein